MYVYIYNVNVFSEPVLDFYGKKNQVRIIILTSSYVRPWAIFFFMKYSFLMTCCTWDVV